MSRTNFYVNRSENHSWTCYRFYLFIYFTNYLHTLCVRYMNEAHWFKTNILTSQKHCNLGDSANLYSAWFHLAQLFRSFHNAPAVYHDKGVLWNLPSQHLHLVTFVGLQEWQNHFTIKSEHRQKESVSWLFIIWQCFCILIVFPLPSAPCEARLQSPTVSGGGTDTDGLHHVRWLEVWTGD